MYLNKKNLKNFSMCYKVKVISRIVFGKNTIGLLDESKGGRYALNFLNAYLPLWIYFNEFLRISAVKLVLTEEKIGIT